MHKSADIKPDEEMSMMKQYPHMSRRDRAKQFAPFAALKGFEAALREKERQIVPRKNLSAEAEAELEQKLRMIRPSDMLTVVYFQQYTAPDIGEYLQITGPVSALDRNAKTLQIADTRIPTAQIYSLKGDVFLSMEWEQA